MRRHDLAAEVWHIKEPQELPPVLSPEEVKRVLTMATSLKACAMLTLSYGCGLRAGDIDSEQMIIRIVQSKGRKDRPVLLPAEILDLLRQWWKAQPTRDDTGVAKEDLRINRRTSGRSRSLGPKLQRKRPHQGRWCFGKTPLQTFLDAKVLAREKLIAA